MILDATSCMNSLLVRCIKQLDIQRMYGWVYTATNISTKHRHVLSPLPGLDNSDLFLEYIDYLIPASYNYHTPSISSISPHRDSLAHRPAISNHGPPLILRLRDRGPLTLQPATLNIFLL